MFLLNPQTLLLWTTGAITIYKPVLVLRLSEITSCFDRATTISSQKVSYYGIALFMIYKPADLFLGSFSISDESALLRTISRASGTRVRAFTDAVRARDNRCVISGRLVRTMNNHRFFEGFDAAYVFPLAYEGYWQDHNYDRWITQVPEVGGTINSVQNGLLLSTEVHHLFDTYCLSVNPDVRDIHSVFRDVLPLVIF